jgi:segregation and condensation protein B
MQFMSSAAKKLAIVHNDEPAPAPEQTLEVVETSAMTESETGTETEITVTVERLEIVETETAADLASRPEELRLLEALLFAAAEPLDEATLSRSLPDGVDVKVALAQLKAEYAPRGVNLVKIGRKWTFRTADDLSWLLTKQTVETRKLSRAAIETLAIVAYHQPVTRAEIEEVRGVATAAGTLDVLLKTGWIRPRGRRKAPGRPITYGTNEAFLSHFGLEEVSDLPGLDELKGAGLLEGNMPTGFAVPLPSDDAALRDDEDPLEPGDLDLGLAPAPEVDSTEEK